MNSENTPRSRVTGFASSPWMRVEHTTRPAFTSGANKRRDIDKDVLSLVRLGGGRASTASNSHFRIGLREDGDSPSAA